MPSRKTTIAAEAALAAMPSIPKELIDQFVTGPMSPEAVQAASMAFKKALIERALGAELSHHLGYAARRCQVPKTAGQPAKRCTSGQNRADTHDRPAAYRGTARPRKQRSSRC